VFVVPNTVGAISLLARELFFFLKAVLRDDETVAQASELNLMAELANGATVPPPAPTPPPAAAPAPKPKGRSGH
jgi:hypothetical protein